MKKIAVVLSGCGVYDGAEIHEAVMTMLAINKAGAEYKIFAPDVEQHHVINHISGEEMNEIRNVLVESARIARGDIMPLEIINTEEFDALILPGGFGAAKNLSTWAFDGSECTVIPQFSEVVKRMHEEKKPIGALCISPAVISKIINNVTVTIGQDEETAEGIESTGATHEKTNLTEVIIDKENKIFSTACYMLDANIKDIADSAENIVNEILKTI